MQVSSFSEIETDFITRVHRMVWCNAATVDLDNKPRSRVLHPIWEGQTGWILTGRHTVKAQQLKNNPALSVAYIAEPFQPVYVDCRVEWVDDLAQKERIWKLFQNTPEPLGYDPGLFMGDVASPGLGLLKLVPWRIELADLGKQSIIWCLQ